MQIEKLVLHVSDAASLIGVSSHKIYEMIQSKELPAYKAGKAWKIPSEAVEDYIKLRLSKQSLYCFLLISRALVTTYITAIFYFTNIAT